MAQDTRGYCDDGDTVVGLDGHCSIVLVEATNSPIHIAPWSRLSTALLEGGGSADSIVVIGECTRHSRGDAEWYAYQKGLALSAQGKATLGACDHSGQSRTFSGCWFESMTVEIDTQTAVRYMLTFRRGEPERGTAEPAYDDTKLQAAPGDYAKATNYVFTANSYSLGDWAQLTPAISRAVVTARIGRCYGMRIKDVRTGRAVRLSVDAMVMTDSQSLFQTALTNMQAGITTGAVTVVGNGCTYENCHMISIGSTQHEERHGLLTIIFEQEIDS